MPASWGPALNGSGSSSATVSEEKLPAARMVKAWESHGISSHGWNLNSPRDSPLPIWNGMSQHTAAPPGPPVKA